MAVFLLKGIALRPGLGDPPTPTGNVFADVPLNHPFAPWIEGLHAAEGITGGCGVNPLPVLPGPDGDAGPDGGFLLTAKHGPDTTRPRRASRRSPTCSLNNPFAKWIYQLAAEGITGGCGTNPARYCPDSPVTRGQMAVFLVRTFNLPH